MQKRRYSKCIQCPKNGSDLLKGIWILTSGNILSASTFPRLPSYSQNSAIIVGDSGVPINAQGELIGINVALISPMGVTTGYGYDIPINKVKSIVKKLIQTGRAG